MKNCFKKVINYKSTNKNLFVSKKRWFQGEQRSDTIKMGSNLAKINDRNILIINIINFIRKYYPERKILVLNKLKQHSIMLKKEVDRLIKQDVENNIIDEDGYGFEYFENGNKIKLVTPKEKDELLVEGMDEGDSGESLMEVTKYIKENWEPNIGLPVFVEGIDF